MILSSHMSKVKTKFIKNSRLNIVNSYLNTTTS